MRVYFIQIANINLNFKVDSNTPSDITFKLECLTQNWCGFIYGKDQVNTDAVKIWRNSQSEIEIFDLLLRGQKLEQIIDPLQDYSIISSGTNSTHIFAEFSRKFDTGDITDYKLEYDTVNVFTVILSDGNEFNSKYDTFFTDDVLISNLEEIECHSKCKKCFGAKQDQCIKCDDSDDTRTSLTEGKCIDNQSLDYELPNYVEIMGWDFKLYWEFIYIDNIKYIDFVLYSRKFSWFSLGLGKDMKDADIWIFTQEKRGTQESWTVKDAYSNQEELAQLDVHSKGGSNDVIITGYQASGLSCKDMKTGYQVIKFQRKLVTEDTKDKPILEGEKNNFIYTYRLSDNEYPPFEYQEQNRGKFEINLINNKNLKNQYKSVIFQLHKLILFINWAVIIEFSIFYIMFMKSYRKYIWVHSILNAWISYSTLFCVISMVIENFSVISIIYQKGWQDQLHLILGVVVVLILVVQHILGILSKYGLEDEKGSQSVYKIKKVHKYLGIFLYIFAKIQVLVGVRRWEQQELIKDIGKFYPSCSSYQYVSIWQFFLYCYYVVLIIFYLIVYWFHKTNKLPQFKKIINEDYIQLQQNEEDYSHLIKLINDGVPKSKIIQLFPKILYTIYENKVYNINDLVHPGGQFILEFIRGKEISRYLNGSVNLEFMEGQAHTHSNYAKRLLQDFEIGQLNTEDMGPLVLDTNKVDIRNLNKVEKKYLDIWKLVDSMEQQNGKERSEFKIFYFVNDNYMIRNYVRGVRWFGRSYIVKIDGIGGSNAEKCKRNYSVILSLNDDNIYFRNQLMLYFKLQMNSLKFNQSINQKISIPTQNEFSTDLNILIKRYRNTSGLSDFIHKNNQSYSNYRIIGPVGEGLGLTEKSEGIHYIFAAGTGILPFIDLFDYLIKKILYQTVKQTFGEQMAQVFNPYDEPYEDTFKPSFSIILFCAFKNKVETYGLPTITDLYLLAQQYWPELFDVSIRYSRVDKNDEDQIFNVIDNRFDKEFVRMQLSANFPDKVLICGPPKMTKDLYDIFHEQGFDLNNVHLV